MPRTARASIGGICYHVINRGNARARVFHHDKDYARFLNQFARVQKSISMRLVGWCIMPNHFHFVLWPHQDGDLGRFMHRWMTSHVQSHRRRYETYGHIWQGRFKGFPIQHDGHLLAVLRYVERNALRANLVDRAEAWPWSSLRTDEKELPLDGPLDRPKDWVAWVNRPQEEAELDVLRSSVNRERPFGDEAWVRMTAQDLHLESSLKPTGRRAEINGFV